MYALNVFYKDADDLKKASILWNVVNYSNKPEMRCNDNAFVSNKILDHNTVFYDVGTNDWYWSEVNQKAATCYIKFGKNNVEYI